jgi:glycosyltransferase involved in cell wall biosynthesis
MQIAFFTDSYLPTKDGTAVVVDGLARALNRLGHRVGIYAPRPDAGATEVSDEGGIEVVRVRSHAVPLYPEYRWPYALSLLRAVRGLSAARAPDVVHVHTPGLVGTSGFFLARRTGVPLVGTFHTDLGAMEESVRAKAGVPTFFRLASWYSLGVYWRCNRAVAPTSLARARMVETATKPFTTPIEVVPNGIDLERYHPGIAQPDWRARCGLEGGALITYLGRLTADKGVHRFLDAISSLQATHDVRAIIAGRGPEEAVLRARLAGDPELGRCVRYVGPVVEEEKPALLAQSDLFVLPSTSDTSSVALLEAMACGTAVVGPTEGGPAEIVRDRETGRKASMRIDEALGATIRELLDDPAERRALADRGQRFVRENASIETMAARYAAIYAELVSGRTAGGA